MDNPIEPPLVEYDDGLLRDQMIEELLGHVLKGNFTTENFDAVFTRVVREHIREDCPHLLASYAGKDNSGASAVNYLAMLEMDFDCIFRSSPHWSDYEYMPKATCAVRVSYANSESMTDWIPGLTVNHAVLGAIVQFCREVSVAHYNQHHLDFGEAPDAN